MIWTHVKALMGSWLPRTGEVLGKSGLVSACCRAGTLAAGLEEWCHQGRWPSLPGARVCREVCREVCSVH